MLFLPWFYRLRGYLVALPLIFAVFCSRWRIEIKYLIWPLGIGLVLIGMIIRIWAQQHLHYRLKVRKHLTATGPFSFVRNPIYIGNIIICIGATMTSELLWFVPITLLYCLWIYSMVVRYEEVHLSEKYGESYRHYMVEVPRWVPRLEDVKNARVKDLGLKNGYFRDSIFSEIQCLLVLVPFFVKKILSP